MNRKRGCQPFSRSHHLVHRYTPELKTNVPTIFVCQVALYAGLSLCSDRRGCRWRTAGILITGKTRRPPIWAQCQNQDGAGSGISGDLVGTLVLRDMRQPLFTWLCAKCNAPRNSAVAFCHSNRSNNKLSRHLVGTRRSHWRPLCIKWNGLGEAEMQGFIF